MFIIHKKLVVRFNFHILFALLILINWCSAQIGRPFIRNYFPEEFEFDVNPETWAIVQDKRGMMYFGHPGGILEYDGVSWNGIPVSNNTIVRSLAMDENGIIYVGAQADFGFLMPNSTGRLTYVSLLNALSEKDKQFADVWQILATPQGVFFKTSNKLFRLKDNVIKVWNAASSFHRSYYIEGTFYVLQKMIGLMQLSMDDNFELTTLGNQFSNSRIYSMLSMGGGEVMLATETNGLFCLNLKEEFRLKTDMAFNLLSNLEEQKTNNPGLNSIIYRFNTAADDYLLYNRIYHGVKLPLVKRGIRPDRYALSTTTGGVLVIYQVGEVIQIINQKVGLQDNMVLYSYADKQNGLWLALNNGISRIENSSPITIFDDKSELKGKVQAIIRHNDLLYVGTSQGLFYVKKNKIIAQIPLTYHPIFYEVNNFKSSCWDLETFQSPSDSISILLAASNDGVFEINRNRASKIRKDYAFVLKQSIKDPSKILVGGFGLGSMQYIDNMWVDDKNIEDISEEIRSIQQDKNGSIWLGTNYKGAINVRKNNDAIVIQRFNVSHGLPEGPIWLYSAMNKIIFATNKGLYKYLGNSNDHPNLTFVPDSSLGRDLAGNTGYVYPLVEDQNKNIWLQTNGVIGVAKPSRSKTDSLSSSWFRKLSTLFIRSE